nr:DUF3293 domain-containing protein [uncultured Flavobacterium sp.]
MTSDQLHQAFLNTSFKVLAKTEFIIKINTIISEVEGLNSWAFITAWNPSPEILPLEENRIRNKNLEDDIIKLGLKCSIGIGISADEQWAEESFLLKIFHLIKQMNGPQNINN